MTIYHIIAMIIISITVYRLWIFHSGICNYKTKDPSQVSLPTKGTQLTLFFEEISKLARELVSPGGRPM